MNPRNTWLWVLVAAVLFGVILGIEKFARKPAPGPIKVLPGLRALEINSVQVLPKDRLPIQVQRTNRVWRLLDPPYPAHGVMIDGLLTVLQELTAAPFIPAAELKGMTNADEQFGFDPPQSSLILGQRNFHILIGNKTSLGDQLFVQVAGAEGVYVVTADLLQLIPQTNAVWRDRALADWNRVLFDRLVVTNAGKVLEVECNLSNRLWRMVHPTSARADASKVENALYQLQGLQVRHFVSDDPKADLEDYGLQNPDLSLAFFRGTNTVLLLHFGKSPTNSADLVYARRDDRSAIVTVPKEAFQSWLALSSHDFHDFLDHRLLALSQPPDHIEIHARDNFTLQRLTNDAWQVVCENGRSFPADPVLMAMLATNLTELEFVDIEKEIVIDTDLPTYGLAPAARQYILKTAGTNGPDGATNVIIAQLDFGIRDDKAYARSRGEDRVYAVNPAVLDRVPAASWHMRDRRIWTFSETNVARIALSQNGRTFEVLRHGTNSWGVAPGSQGEIQSDPVEEVAHRLGELSAAVWLSHNDQDRAQYGFTNSFQLTVELRDGRKLSVELGGRTASDYPCAIVMFDQEPWIFEIPLPLYYFVQTYLRKPSGFE